MIKLSKGNLLEANVEALVNTVNCVGVMGKGIALQFKQGFPENFKVYEKACKSQEVQVGHMFVYETHSLLNPRYIINFPTKRHWKGKSRIVDVEDGLLDLIKKIKELNIRTIAIPPLGSGLGGLYWPDVKSRIMDAFKGLEDVEVLLYEPAGAPAPDKMPVRTKRPKMTNARALFVKLINLYGRLGYQLTLLEIQKLAYFLQEAGEDLRLSFGAKKYGPYAENLQHALQGMEGHFIRGYGDRMTKAQIRILPEALEEADKYLEENEEAERRLEKIQKLIEGFETPYGMELLSTVHWVTAHEKQVTDDPEAIVSTVFEWSERKKQIMKPKHIIKAWDHLKESGWIRV